MNKKEYRRDLLSIARSWLFIMLFYTLINFLCISYYEIKGFLLWFDFVAFLGIALIIFLLDMLKYKIIDGKLK